jgi:hypothetical protein
MWQLTISNSNALLCGRDRVRMRAPRRESGIVISLRQQGIGFPPFPSPLSLDKMSSGLDAFEISDIQEEKPALANLTMGV